MDSASSHCSIFNQGQPGVAEWILVFTCESGSRPRQASSREVSMWCAWIETTDVQRSKQCGFSSRAVGRDRRAAGPARCPAAAPPGYASRTGSGLSESVAFRVKWKRLGLALGLTNRLGIADSESQSDSERLGATRPERAPQRPTTRFRVSPSQADSESVRVRHRSAPPIMLNRVLGIQSLDP